MKRIFIVLYIAILFANCKQGMNEKNEIKPKNYTITVTQPENGKITIKNKATNAIIESEALKKIVKGTEVSIILEATAACKVKALIVDGARNTFKMMNKISQDITVNKNISVESEIETRYSLTIHTSEGGKINIEKKGKYGYMEMFPTEYISIEPNITIRITLIPDTTHEGKTIIINGDKYEATQKEISVDRNLNISAEFNKKTQSGFSVTIVNPEHGTITVKYIGHSEILSGEALKNIPDGSVLVIRLNFDATYGDMQNSKLIINKKEYPFSKKYTIHEDIEVTGKVAKTSNSYSSQDDKLVTFEAKRILGKSTDYELPLYNFLNYTKLLKGKQ